jgi:hypothetical protein
MAEARDGRTEAKEVRHREPGICPHIATDGLPMEELPKGVAPAQFRCGCPVTEDGKVS